MANPNRQIPKALGLVLLAIVGACADRTPGPPVLESISPASAPFAHVGEIAIAGRDFYQKVGASFDNTSLDEFDDRFVVTLRGESSTIELGQVRWLDVNSLSAEAPADLAVGSYDLVVTGPRGASNTLANAFTVCNDEDGDGNCECTDADADGFGQAGTDQSGCASAGDDCDDMLETRFPGAPELADDGVDQDCNGSDTVTCILDSDMDGFGNAQGTTTLAPDGRCDTSDAEALTATDCDDNANTTFPGAAPNDGPECMSDQDGDDFGDATPALGVVAGSDCDDTVANCTTDCTDADGDGLALCAGDCDDTASTGASCTAGCTPFFADTDTDGFGDFANPATASCVAPANHVANSIDCDDAVTSCTTDCTNADGDSLALCAGDCDDSTATGASCTGGCPQFFEDADGDTYGLLSSTLDACVAPVGYVLDSQDCADSTPIDPLCGGTDGNFCNPGVREGPLGNSTCSDSADNDCDGLVDSADPDCSEFVTCEDSLQNGDESGIDCGGSLCAPCSTATAIYRSMGPGNTLPLTTGVGNSLEIVGATATFALGFPNRVGVGDVIQYDSDDNGSVDALAFVHRRISSTELDVRDAAGSAVTPTASPDGDWSMFRAYTSLKDAERGAENTGIVLGLRDFDAFTIGKDLVASNEVWNIACYADAVENEAIVIKDWVTAPNNLIRVFVPFGTSQVGESQRHDGSWNTSAFFMDVALGSDRFGIEVEEDFVRIQGIQIRANGGGVRGGVIAIGLSGAQLGASNDVRISHSLGADTTRYGISADNGISWKLWNTVIFDIVATTDSVCVFQDQGSTLVAYNNTGFNCSSGISQIGGATTMAKNNIFPSYAGTFEAGSDNNISGDLTTAGGASDQTSVAMDFIDAANGDFHLAPSFNAAVGQALDLGADASLSFQDDLDREVRSPPWSIGADQ